MAHHEAINPQDIVNWLYEQLEAPHPLRTSIDTMMDWLQAMDTGASRLDLERLVGPVMQLWLEQGIPNELFTRHQQEQHIAQRGADMRPVVLTTSWQHYLLARVNGESEENEREEEEQPIARFGLSAIVSINTTPIQGTHSVDPAAAADLPSGLPRSQPASESLQDLFSGHADTVTWQRRSSTPPFSEDEMVPMSSSPPDLRVRRFYHAPGPLPDLFPGYENPWKAATDHRPSADGHEPELP
jgi:hypothetical protein